MKKREEGESLVAWHNNLDAIDRQMFDTWFSNYLTNLANKSVPSPRVAQDFLNLPLPERN